MDVLQGTLELLILETLAAAQELHGFGILDWIRESTEGDLQIEEGALYPALHRMQKRGLLASTWGISSKGRRARYYCLTDAGREALAGERARWKRYVSAVEQIATSGRG